jgi:hypothetical protein
MSKKIKISESQLARLVKQNAILIKEEESMGEMVSVGMVEISAAKEVASMVKNKFSEMSIDASEINMDIFSRALAHELSQQGEDMNTEKMTPETDDELMGDDNFMDSVDKGDEFSDDESEMQADETLSETVKGYRTEFDRYMKGPKI